MKVIEAQRVDIFVDVQNMYYAARDIFGGRLKFPELLDTIVKGRQLVRAIAYVVENNITDQSGFFTVLQASGFEVKSKSLRVRPDGTSKGDWDMGIALDALALSDKVDVVALVSGDGDFTELVYFLRSRGVRVEIFAFTGTTAESLVRAAEQYTPLGEEHVMPITRNRRPPAAPESAERRRTTSAKSALSEDEFALGIFED